MTIDEKSKEYAHKMWGDEYHDILPAEINGIMLTFGEISEKDFKRGAIEGQINLFEELLKSGHLKEGYYKEYFDKLDELKAKL